MGSQGAPSHRDRPSQESPGDRGESDIMSVKGSGFKDLFQLMKDDLFTDIKLKTADGCEFSCHRCVLASKSDYFRALFSNAFCESSQDSVTIENVAASTMPILLEYIYTSQCSFHFDKFGDLLVAANMMLLTELEKILLDKFDLYCVQKKKENFPKLVFEMWLWLCKESLTVPQQFKTKEMVHAALPLIQKSGHESLVWDLDVDTFLSFLADLERQQNFDDQALYWVTGWMSAEPGSRLKHLERFMHQFKRLDLVPDGTISSAWANTPLKPHITQALAVKRKPKRPLVIMPYDHEGRTKFIAHDLQSTRTYEILAPGQDSGFRMLGQPQLTSSSESLVCLQAGVTETDNELNYIEHEFLLNRWDSVFKIHRYEHPKSRLYDMDYKYQAFHDRLPSTITGFTVPVFLPDATPKKAIPIVQRSYVNVKEEVEEGGGVAIVKMHFVEGLALDGSSSGYSFVKFKDGTKSMRVANDGKPVWKYMAPKFHLELPGTCVYGGCRKEPVVFGNLSREDGSDAKSLILSAYSSFRHRTCPMPHGPCTVPLSIISVGPYTFFIQSCPDRSARSAGLSMPRLCLTKVGKEQNYDKEIPTPSFPDIDYASLFYDWRDDKLYLVLVQGLKHQRVFTVADATCEPDHTVNPDGRLVGLFQTKMDARALGENASYFESKTHDEIWNALPVCETTANFLSLGCSLPGEVRFTWAPVETYHLQPVSLLSRRHEDDCVVVDFEPARDENDDPPVYRDELIPNIPRWKTWQRSPYCGETSKSLEQRLNKLLVENPSLLDAMRVRTINSNHQFEIDLTM